MKELIEKIQEQYKAFETDAQLQRKETKPQVLVLANSL